MEETELRQSMAMLELSQSQLDNLLKQIQMTQMSLEDLNKAKETMTEFAKAQEGDDILVPIGANSFVYAKVASNDKALVGIGSRVTLDKPMTEAIATMDQGIEELKEGLTGLEKARKDLEAQTSQLQLMLQKEYGRAQGQ